MVKKKVEVIIMVRGGKRRGAGRPKGSGKYGESTKAIRLPVSMIKPIVKFISQKALCLPAYTENMKTSEAMEIPAAELENIELAKWLVEDPAATAFFKITDNSMFNAGIYSGDLLIVDRKALPSNGDIVIADIDKNYLVKRIFISGNKVELRPESSGYETIVYENSNELVLWGVVKKIIHRV